MSHFPDRLYVRVALIGMLAVSLGLAACGRKGPLDLPPGAASSEGKAASSDGQQQPAGATLMRSPFDKSGGNTPGTGPREVPDKPFILDPLLN